MIRTFLSTLALLTIATPASAGTWVTYLERTGPSDSIHRRHQVDIQSISKHQGWTHANLRICHDYGRDCKDTIFTASAHCKDKELKAYGTVTHTLRNNTEWWTSWETEDNTRYKYVEPDNLKRQMQIIRRLDSDKTSLFNFLCSGNVN